MRKELLDKILWVDCLFKSNYELLIEHAGDKDLSTPRTYRDMAIGHIESLFALNHLTKEEYIEAYKSLDEIYIGGIK